MFPSYAETLALYERTLLAIRANGKTLIDMSGNQTNSVMTAFVEPADNALRGVAPGDHGMADHYRADRRLAPIP